ncbi:bc0669f5-5eef-4021-88af-057f7237d178 [Sclerotinia trifoliorum]|uniref:Bc0669f5-5eef-4021-88af-057f7237d178 n=1 Tax=Sclerotinia trifoliorum TaxID=28548 RepID=A0A8H2ZVE1_9HELO|nr:bc0669f5-5eef-4021-88af-057f7237d178 [Sclerotinia trifoliorum]
MVFDWLQRAVSPIFYPIPSPTFSPLYQKNTKAQKKRKHVEYGIELEYVLAFHELELNLSDQEGRSPDHGIEKNIRLAIRRHPAWSPTVMAGYERASKLIYNSWAIRINNVKDKDQKQDLANLRPYHLEPQSIVLNKLNDKVAQLRGNVRHKGPQKASEKVPGAYDQWIISTDSTVVGQGSSNLYKWLPRISGNVSKRWDSYGIEVISPVLRSNSTRDRVELEQVLNALKGEGDELYEGFITNQCALQVHVEPPSLAALKELACILLIYEDEISRLHPRCRRPGHQATRGNIISNRTLTFLGRNFTTFEDNVGEVWDQNMDVSVFKKRRTIRQIRNEIHQLQDESAVADYMCFPATSRLRIVNFRPLRYTKFPRTIEFRQARGSLDIHDVNYWVDFCVGLVQLAEYYVENPGARIQSWDEDHDGHVKKLDIFQLMEDMNLDERTMRYWRHRVAKHMAGSNEDDRTDIENLPVNRKEKPSSKTPFTSSISPVVPPGGPLGGPFGGLSGESLQPKPQSDKKATEPSGDGKAKPESSPRLKVPPLISPATQSAAEDSSIKIEPEKPISDAQARFLGLLDTHAEKTSNRPFFDVDTSEGSTIPPASLVDLPDVANMETVLPRAEVEFSSSSGLGLEFKVEYPKIPGLESDSVVKYPILPGLKPEGQQGAQKRPALLPGTKKEAEPDASPESSSSDEAANTWDDPGWNSDDDMMFGIFSGDIDDPEPPPPGRSALDSSESSESSRPSQEPKSSGSTVVHSKAPVPGGPSKSSAGQKPAGKRQAGEPPEDKKNAKEQKTQGASEKTLLVPTTKKRPAEEPAATEKDVKKHKTSHKTSATKTTGKYTVEGTIDILKQFRGLEEEDLFAEVLKELYDTTPGNVEIVSEAFHQYTQNHRTPLPFHVPGHGTESDEKLAQQLQEEFEDANMALIRQLQNEENEKATREAGSKAVAPELRVDHPPVEKIGKEELEVINAGTPNERLRIKNFNKNEWQTINTTAVIARQFGVCGAAAVVHSLRNQYPNEPWMQGMTNERFLKDWLKTVPNTGDPGRNKYWDEEQLNNAVQRLTKGQLQIAVVHKGLENSDKNAAVSIPEAAILTANGEPARYLYLHLTHSAFVVGSKGVPYQHFEGMKRKNGFVEHK